MHRSALWTAAILGFLSSSNGRSQDAERYLPNAPVLPANPAIDGAVPTAPAPATNLRDRQAASATHQAVGKLLQDLWSERRDTVKLIAQGVVRSSVSEGADPFKVNYAAGLLMLHQQHWDEAADYFLKASKLQPNVAGARLGLAAAQLHMNQNDAALDNILKAAQADPRSPLATDMAAATAAFYSDPASGAQFRQGALTELEREVFGNLDADLRDRYQDTVRLTRDHIANIPTMRSAMLEAVRNLEVQLLQIQTNYRLKQNERLQLQTSLESLIQQITMRKANMANMTLSYDQRVLSAEAAGAISAAAGMRNSKMMEMRQAVLQINALGAEIDRIQKRIAQLDIEIAADNKSYRELQAKIGLETAKVDTGLAFPPLPYDPLTQRDALISELQSVAEADPRVDVKPLRSTTTTTTVQAPAATTTVQSPGTTTVRSTTVPAETVRSTTVPVATVRSTTVPVGSGAVDVLHTSAPATTTISSTTPLFDPVTTSSTTTTTREITPTGTVVRQSTTPAVTTETVPATTVTQTTPAYPAPTTTVTRTTAPTTTVTKTVPALNSTTGEPIITRTIETTPTKSTLTETTRTVTAPSGTSVTKTVERKEPAIEGAPALGKGAADAERKAMSMFHMGESLRKTGRMDEAKEYYKRTILLYPSSVGADSAQQTLLELDSKGQ